MKTSPLHRYTTFRTRTPLKRNSKRMRAFSKVDGPEVDGQKVWSVAEADSKFSQFIRNRDGKCLWCGSPYMLTCSHFYGRSIWATRFDPEDCVTFCIYCHDLLESQKSLSYKEFMITYLGIGRFNDLEQRSRMKISRYDAITQCMKLLSGQEEVINY